MRILRKSINTLEEARAEISRLRKQLFILENKRTPSATKTTITQRTDA